MLFELFWEHTYNLHNVAYIQDIASAARNELLMLCVRHPVALEACIEGAGSARNSQDVRSFLAGVVADVKKVRQ